MRVFIPVIVCHEILNSAPCALQQDLVVNPSCFTSSHLLTPNSPYFPGNTPHPWQPHVCEL